MLSTPTLLGELERMAAWTHGTRAADDGRVEVVPAPAVVRLPRPVAA